jgi:hypothetical protein
MRFDPTRALLAYSALATAAFGWTLLGGAAAPTSFDTIDVHRINLREDDGTVRMIIAARDRFPGMIVHNRERPHPDRSDSAGMIFYNDEGTENGGLIFGGRKTGGKVSNFGHLSFDHYDQDQVVALEQTEDAGQREGGLTVADLPDASIDFAAIDRLEALPADQRRTALAKLRASGAGGHHRAFFGKNAGRDALLDLRDAQGRTRLRLRVTATGDARIEFLDAGGKVVRSVAG